MGHVAHSGASLPRGLLRPFDTMAKAASNTTTTPKAAPKKSAYLAVAHPLVTGRLLIENFNIRVHRWPEEEADAVQQVHEVSDLSVMFHDHVLTVVVRTEMVCRCA